MKILLLTLLIFIAPGIIMAGSLRSPQEFSRNHQAVNIKAESTSFAAYPFLAIVLGYQHIFGPLKGSYCPMYPSCSSYGYEAIQRHNLKGVLMTVDRLHRCAHDLHLYDKVIINKKIKNLDLVR